MCLVFLGRDDSRVSVSLIIWTGGEYRGVRHDGHLSAASGLTGGLFGELAGAVGVHLGRLDQPVGLARPRALQPPPFAEC